MTKQDMIIGAIILALVAVVAVFFGAGKANNESTGMAADKVGADMALETDRFRAYYSPLHFRPAAATASDEQCLACHREILDRRVSETSPAGVKTAESKAWYQQVSTYAGEQETFHRRHLVTPMANQLMDLKCNTCHVGIDPREEAPGSSADVSQNTRDITLRKQVNPETTCLKCHGAMPAKEIMGLTGAWSEVKGFYKNGCFDCHNTQRTNRHNVTYLKPEAIETAGKQNSDVCHGCHGARSWYRIAFPYPRNAWPNMPELTPEWAALRPTHSENRFLPQPSTSGKVYQGK